MANLFNSKTVPFSSNPWLINFEATYCNAIAIVCKSQCCGAMANVRFLLKPCTLSILYDDDVDKNEALE